MLVVRLQVDPQRVYPLGLEEMGRTVVRSFPDIDFMQQPVQPLSGPCRMHRRTTEYQPNETT